MPDDETREEKLVSQELDEAATGRRWGFSLVMVVLGIATVVAGVLIPQSPLIIVGALLILSFGYIAAGGTGLDLGAPGGWRAKITLPRRSRTRTLVRKTGFPKHGKSPAAPADDDSPDPPSS